MSKPGSLLLDRTGTGAASEVARLREVRETLAHINGHGAQADELVDLITGLEELKAAAAAAQARATVALDASLRAAARPHVTQDKDRLGRHVSAQVALARRESPSRGQTHLGVALALVRELPHTHAALTRGELSEYRAMLIVRETACLARADRTAVDAELATRSTQGFLTGWGDRKVADAARSIAYRLDPAAAVRRAAKAESDRRVSIRPAPDTMVNLTGLLPVGPGVAAYSSIRKHAEALKAAGDPRTLGQLMADTLHARLTGQADPIADGQAPQGPAVHIGVVMPARVLFGSSQDAAHVEGYGGIPAGVARRLVRSADEAWLRRLYADPTTGELVAMDSRRRLFDGSRRELLVLRDQTCRTPWCDAPFRHADHVKPVIAGGTTTVSNGQGTCEACNYTKQGPGWRADFVDGSSIIRLRAPTGHEYDSSPPAQPGTGPPRDVEQHFDRQLDDEIA